MAGLKLKPLFISKVRIKLLEVFLNNPSEIYYVRQLVRITREEINAVRRELEHMAKADMVSKENRGNRLYYWFNKNYLFYEDLVSMISKTTGLGEAIIKNKPKLGRLHLVMFSSKFVNLKPRDLDEIDILIVGNIVLPELNLLVQAEEKQLKREINYTVMTKDEFEFRRSKHDPFIMKILTAPRIMIIGNQLELVGKDN